MPTFYNNDENVSDENDRTNLTSNSPSSSSSLSIDKQERSNEIKFANQDTIGTSNENYFARNDHHLSTPPNQNYFQAIHTINPQILQGQNLRQIHQSYIVQQDQQLQPQSIVPPISNATPQQNFQTTNNFPPPSATKINPVSPSSNGNNYNHRALAQSSLSRRVKEIPGRNTYFQKFLSKYLFLDFLNQRAAIYAYFIFLSLFFLFFLTIVEHLIIMNHREENFLLNLFDDERRNEIFYDEKEIDTDYGSYYFILVLLFSCDEVSCNEYEVPITILVLNTLTYIAFFFLVYISLKNNRARYNYGASRFGVCCTCCCVPLHIIYSFILIEIKIYCIYWMYVWSNVLYVDDDELQADELPIKNYGPFTWWVIFLSLIQFPMIITVAQLTNVLRNMDTFVDQHIFSSEVDHDPESLDRIQESYFVKWVVNNQLPRLMSTAIQDSNKAIIGVGNNILHFSSTCERAFNCILVNGICSICQVCVLVIVMISLLGVVTTGLTASSQDYVVESS